MPDQRARRRQRLLAGPDPRHQQHRDQALGKVEQQRRRRQPLAPGPQHVGGADVARADLAQVARAGHACQYHPEGDRPQQVSDQQRRQRRHPDDLGRQRSIPLAGRL
jgi:hypothetical protein